jgi:hypothetical protein
MCMLIDGLKDKKLTHIHKKWLARLMKHPKKAQSSNIKQIRFIRHIGRLDIYDDSREYEIEDDCYIYEVNLIINRCWCRKVRVKPRVMHITVSRF